MNENAEAIGGLPEVDALTFKFPGGSRAIMLGCSIFFLCCLIGTNCVLLRHPDSVSLGIAAFGNIFYGVGTYLSFQYSQHARDSVAVDGNGIWYLHHHGDPTYIAWSDIAAVKALDTQQRLVLLNHSGTKKIRLEYRLENFSELRAYVLSHALALTPLQNSSNNIFHRTWINKIILLAGAGFCLFAAYGSIQQPKTCLLFIGFGCAVLISITQDPTSLQITDRSVVITYPGWKRNIDLHTVTGVSLTDISDAKGNVWAAVIIDRQKGKPIKLFRFREGSIALCESIQSAWRTIGETSKKLG